MLFDLLTAVALVLPVLSHEDHEYQTPISGPHKSLWYNTIPGDGGTQVRKNSQLQLTSIDEMSGRLCLLRHFHLRTSAILSVFSQ
jgi:hypothetical protein